MKHTLSPRLWLGLILLGTAFSQQGSRRTTDQAPTEVCGLDGAHECYCLRRTQLLQDEHQAACDQKFDRFDKAQKKQWLECAGELPAHCDIVLNSPRYGHPWIEDSTNHEWTDGRCTVACKKHHCKCDDGPICRNVP
jgi:hypothetical protein